MRYEPLAKHVPKQLDGCRMVIKVGGLRNHDGNDSDKEKSKLLSCVHVFYKT